MTHPLLPPAFVVPDRVAMGVRKGGKHLVPRPRVRPASDLHFERLGPLAGAFCICGPFCSPAAGPDFPHLL
ncbi:hypothetical protein H4F99_05535 [Lysobacter sp. SG-8]|uniref:Uncharacterized protein n=1 Tax=Marilutibacter penaei TaxID=2759900 RepID=A0A7W3U3G8_9GAMM|nr:hypothetical protein [Lysobacter penaei]